MPTDAKVNAAWDAVVRSQGKRRADYLANLRRAARLGHSEAMSRLACAYFDGARGRGWRLLPNHARAVELFRRAVKLRNLGAMVMLAECYAEGKGVRRNRATARRLLLRAAQAGFSIAALNLAGMAEVDGDRAAEVAALRIAERLGDPIGSIELARIDVESSSRTRRVRALEVLRAARRSKDELNKLLGDRYLAEYADRRKRARR